MSQTMLKSIVWLGVSLGLMLAVPASVSGDWAARPGGTGASLRLAGSLSLPLPAVHMIASSAALPGVLLAGFETAPLPIYSLNGGITWNPVATAPWGGSAPLVAIVSRPEEGVPVRFIVATAGGVVYRSGDYGQTWASAAFPHPIECTEANTITSLVVSRADPTRLYLTAVCYEDNGTGSRAFTGVYTSPDAGITWLTIKAAAPAYWWGLTPSPSLPARVYLADGSAHWFQSDDSGVTWSPKNFPGEGLVLDAQAADRLYGISYGVGWRSVNGGVDWVNWVEAPPCSNSGATLRAHPTETNVLFMQCDAGIFRSNDGGDHWQKLSAWRGQWLGADFGQSGRLLWARYDGLWVSDNQGTAWARQTDSYGARREAWLNVSPPDCVGPTLALAALAENDVWISTGTPHALWQWNGAEWYTHTITSASMETLVFTAPDEGWGLGGNTVEHWNGETWEVMTTTAYSLYTLDVVSPDAIWVGGGNDKYVGNQSFMMHWDGLTWNVISLPTDHSIQSLDMVSAAEGWAVSGYADDLIGNYGGDLLRWQAGVGEDWEVVTTTTRYMPTVVKMASATSGWLAGWRVGSMPLRYWDGLTWHEPILTEWEGGTFLPVSMRLRENEGWLLAQSGQNNNLMHWDGQTWKPYPLPNRLPSLSMDWLPSGQLWVGGGSTGDVCGWVVRSQAVFSTYLPMVQR